MHKIRNIDKKICTCEQKIAYNYAFSYRDILSQIRQSHDTKEEKSKAYQRIINMVREDLERNGTGKRYHIAEIVECFANGIENYLNSSPILTNYQDIGKVFPYVCNSFV